MYSTLIFLSSKSDNGIKVVLADLFVRKTLPLIQKGQCFIHDRYRFVVAESSLDLLSLEQVLILEKYSPGYLQHPQFLNDLKVAGWEFRSGNSAAEKLWSEV